MEPSNTPGFFKSFREVEQLSLFSTPFTLSQHVSIQEKADDLGHGRLGNGAIVRNRPEEVDDEKPVLEADDSQEIRSAFDEYNRQKEAHPNHVVLVQVGDHYETYGEDAKTIQPILDSNLLERSIPGAGRIEMTGFTPASRWTEYSKQLWSKGHDVLLLGVSEQGEYETIKEYRKDDFIPVGMELTLDGRKFVIDSVNYAFGNVSLRDITFASGTGFPIFRSEPIDFVRSYVEEQQWENVEKDAALVPNGTTPEPAPITSDKLRSVTIYSNPNEAPEVAPPAGNYRIHDDHLGEGGQRAKADRNIDAIRTLKRVESERRGATRDEQETLAQYVGWGGIPQIFDEANTDWQERHERLKELLTTNEYNAARASTLNAHYTSPVVVRTIYQGLKDLGFHQGNILEPACGIGNFFGALPEDMASSKLYGVELDSITGRIAQKLYPEAQIAVQGFEHSALPDDFFDVAVGNVPFGAYSLPDPKYDRYHFRIHDYFVSKMLDKVRPGGIIAFVTSKGTLDKQDSNVRRYIAQRAELLGAIRLPNTAFKLNAGTEVTTDILFLQKRERMFEAELDWLHVGQTTDGVPINHYYLAHPEMILGTMSFDKSMYGNEQETTCNALPNTNLAEQLQAAVQNIQGRYEAVSIDDPSPDESRIPVDPTVPNFSFVVRNDRVYYRRDHWMERCDLNAMDDKRARGMILLRDLTRELIQAQLSGVSDEAIHSLQAELNKRYDSFTQQFGLLSDKRNAAVFREDDGYYLLTSLEILDDERKLERILFGAAPIRPFPAGKRFPRLYTKL